MTDDELDYLRSMYPMVRPHDDTHAVVLVPLTFGRWRVSRCTTAAVLDGY